MHRLCEANGIRYYHFLQPNQYVPGSKILSADELRNAFDPHYPSRAVVVAGYPYLEAAGRELTAAGVHFYDLTEIFKAHPETIYFDTCCHVNRHGCELMANQIVDRMRARADFDSAEDPSVGR